MRMGVAGKGRSIEAALFLVLTGKLYSFSPTKLKRQKKRFGAIYF